MRPFVNKYGAEELIIPTIIMIALLPIFAQILNKHRTTKPIKNLMKMTFLRQRNIRSISKINSCDGMRYCNLFKNH